MYFFLVVGLQSKGAQGSAASPSARFFRMRGVGLSRGERLSPVWDIQGSRTTDFGNRKHAAVRRVEQNLDRDRWACCRCVGPLGPHSVNWHAGIFALAANGRCRVRPQHFELSANGRNGPTVLKNSDSGKMPRNFGTRFSREGFLQTTSPEWPICGREFPKVAQWRPSTQFFNRIGRSLRLTINLNARNLQAKKGAP